MTIISNQEHAKRVMERRSRSRSPDSLIQLNRWDSGSGTATENWTPDGSDSSNGGKSNDSAVDLLAEENTKATKDCTQESQTNVHTSQTTCTPCSSDPDPVDRKWRALMCLPVDELLKLDIIHKIIEKLNDLDLVYVVQATLNLEDLDFIVQKRIQYEVICTPQNQRVDDLNDYLEEEVVEISEFVGKHARDVLHNKLYSCCKKNPEEHREMLRNNLRQLSTLKAFNALIRQIWALSTEERDKLGDDAIEYFQRKWGPSEVDAMYWPPVRW